MCVIILYIGNQGANDILVNGNFEQINLPNCVTVE
jgi:hypothetical protein